MPDSWDDDKPMESAQTCAPGSWLDNLFITSLKTAAVGTGAPDKKICVRMRVGKCPICHERVERSPDDIFFPYCGYSHKRIDQREDEKRAREEFERDYYYPYEAIRANKHRHNALYKRRKRRRELEEKLKQARATYDEVSKRAVDTPKGSKERGRLNKQARWWYLSVIEIQRQIADVDKQIKELEAHKDAKSVVQGHEQDGASCDARAGNE